MEVSERERRFDFDPSVPQAARIYDAWLGGKDHYGADRETADRVIELRPQVVAAAQTVGSTAGLSGTWLSATM